jgi:tetratricopeptide (TPR) repeat protein
MQQPVQQSQPTPKQVFEEAYRMLRVGDVYEAAKRAGKLRMHFPEDIPILSLHGFVLAKMGVHPQALSDLIKAAQLTEHALENEEDENPARPRIVDQLIRLCVQICQSSMVIGEYKAAEESIEQAIKWDPDRGDAIAAKAELLSLQGKLNEALELLAQGQKDMLDSMPIVLSKARVLLGAQSPDEENLKAVIVELEAESQVSGLAALDLGDLLRAIGMVHDRLGNFDESFNAFRRAAKLRRGSYDPRAHAMMTKKVINDWNSETLGKIIKPQVSGERQVFLLGAPKSGVEELGDLLGQFDDVSVIGPLETLSSVCAQHLGARQGVMRPVPLEPGKLRGNQLKDASDAYIAQAKGLMTEGAAYGIDTHPLNIPLAGAAAVMMPGANIVICRRDMIESALACYCDAMVGNHPYAGDLVNAAGFVSDCNRMLDHWVETLSSESVGANVIEVSYDELASDPKKTAAKIAREIGLDARATSIKRMPAFDNGPGTHPGSYNQFTKQIEGFFAPSDA